jgi:hypothetical protein
MEVRKNFSERSIVRAIRRVLGSQWRTSRQLIARCNSATETDLGAAESRPRGGLHGAFGCRTWALALDGRIVAPGGV